MDSKKFIELAKKKVAFFSNAHAYATDSEVITEKDIYVVWSCKILGNNKALLSTTIPDGMYYELTYNGACGKLYLDAYKRSEKLCFVLKEDDK